MSNTFSKKISEQEINLILKYMSSHLKENNNKSINYFFKTKKYTITIYKNQTILIQGEDYNNILKMLNINNELSNIKPLYNTGSDESGNGDFFGGIAVCACYLDKEIENKIKRYNITDSKLLNDEQIIEIAEKIINIIPNKIEYITPKEYNMLFDEYKNINTIKTILHARAINNLNFNDKSAIIDQYTTKQKFSEHLTKANIKLNCNYDLETKAESKYLVVAAASILARYKFICEFKEIEKKIGHKLPLGSVDKKILPILKELKNKIVLNDVCKTHFKTINKIN